jgi:hypothetical protein
VTIPAGIPTFVSETDWEVGRKLEEIRRRLATNVMRISSKLTAAIAMAIVPSAEILRLADAEESKAPELKSAALPDAAAVKAAAEHIGTTSTRLAEVLRDVPAALASAEQPDVPESVAIEVPEAVEPVVEAPAPSDPEVVAEPVIEPPPEESKPAVAPEDPAAERVATTVMPPVPTETKPRRRSR